MMKTDKRTAPVPVPKRSTIGRQLIWAAAFPLTAFGLLTILLITSAFQSLSLNRELARNEALAQLAAFQISTQIRQSHPSAQTAAIAQEGLAWLNGVEVPLASGSQMALLDGGGHVMAQTGSVLLDGTSWPVDGQKGLHSQLINSPASGDPVVYSYVPIPDQRFALVLEEPWPVLFSSAVYYEAIVAAFLALGVILSLVMLSASVRRVVQPLTKLASQANALGPGSVFHPVQTEGPEETVALTLAFNQMVIRLAEQQAALRQYAEKAMLSQEEERQRISHELHDETVQELVGLLQRVDLCRTEIEQDPALARHRLDELKTLAETALGDLRRISNALRPSILQDLGLPEALRSLCDELERQMPEVTCAFSQVGEERRLEAELELAIYRVVQEALTNIRRHSANVSQVSVRLEMEPEDVQVVINDNGTSYELPQVSALVRDGHLGVAGMYERARLFGGELTIQPCGETGTTITLWLPLNR